MNYPNKAKNLTQKVTDDVTGQVKVRIFDFSGLVTTASKISMLSAIKANESAWIVSLTSVGIISSALRPYYRSRSSQVTRWKSSNIFFRDLELRYMFLGQIFAKNTKNEPNTLFEASKSVKNKLRKITVKSRNDMKSACFWHVLCYISAIFEDIDLKFCTHIHETLPSNTCYVFLIDLGETVSKIKNGHFFGFFFSRNFQNCENPR